MGFKSLALCRSSSCSFRTSSETRLVKRDVRVENVPDPGIRKPDDVIRALPKTTPLESARH
ncbi:MAG TPA: hypothetical protein VKO84_05155 [Gaiellaceae bacterium]|nr:hypothetical protein [Gaiellaceae bacterium]